MLLRQHKNFNLNANQNRQDKKNKPAQAANIKKSQMGVIMYMVGIRWIIALALNKTMLHTTSDNSIVQKVN